MIPPRGLQLTALLLCLGVGAWLGAALAGRSDRGEPPLASAARLQQRVEAAESRMAALVARAEAQLRTPAGTADPLATLAQLELPPAAGIAVYRDRQLLAWGGLTSVEAGAGPDSGLWISGPVAAPTMAFGRLAGDLRLVAEVSLDALLEGVARRTAVIATNPEESTAVLRRTGTAPRGVAITTGQGQTFAVIAVTSLPSGGESALATRLERLSWLLGALAALALGLSLLANEPRPGLAHTLLSALAFLVFRLLAGRASLGNTGTLFAPGALAVAAPMDLLRSPGSFLLTGLALLLIAVAVALALRAGSALLPEGSRTAAALAALMFAAVLSVVGTRAALALELRAAQNTELDLSDFSLWPWTTARIAAVLGLTLIALALLTVVTALAALARAALAERIGRGPATLVVHLAWLAALLASAALSDASPSRLGVLAARHALALPWLWLGWSHRRRPRVALLAVVATALVLEAGARVNSSESLEQFLANELAGRLKSQEEVIRVAIQDTLADLGGRAGRALEGLRPEEICWLAWRASALPPDGYRSAVDVRAPDGSPARFSHRLPLPPGIREVEPGTLIHQEVIFQGRAQRVLAGSARLGDGTLITLRVAVDDEGLPFFGRVNSPRAALRGESGTQIESLRRERIALIVTDSRGRPLARSSSRTLEIPPRVAAEADTVPRWWRGQSAGMSIRGLSFLDGGRVLTLAWPTRSASARAASALHACLLVGILASISLLVAALFHPAARQLLPGRHWLRASYHRKVLASFVLAATLPAVPAALYLGQTVEREKLQSLREQSLSALELARRILGELALDGSGATLDDSSLIWLSETVGHELTLFRDGDLIATSMRDLYREGRLGGRAPARVWRRLSSEGAALEVELSRRGDPIALTAFAPVGDDALLALHAVAHQSDIEHAASERERSLFLVSAALVGAALLLSPAVARRSTAPLRQLAEGAARIASGDLTVRIPTRREDELGALIAAFNRMASELDSERHLLAEKRAYLELLLENAPTGILSTDGEGRVTTVNPAARALLGVELEEGDRVADRLREAAHLSDLARSLAGDSASGRSNLELKPPSPATPERTLRVVVVPLVAQDPAGGRLVLLEDVTAIVRSKQLDAWAEMARRVAHEIKNPLTPIQLAAEHARRLAEDRRPGFESALDRCLATILRQVQDLRHIAREFSTYGAPVPALEPSVQNLRSWLGEVLEPYRNPLPPGLRVVLEARSDLSFSFDASRLRRALVNLIENAIQAMPGGGELEVSARSLGAGELEIAVRDSGRGIPDELRSRLFDPYFSTKDTGSGLGLANARRIVEQHGGRIEIASSSEQGTTIVVILPRQPQPQGDPVNPGAGERGGPRTQPG